MKKLLALALTLLLACTLTFFIFAEDEPVVYVKQGSANGNGTLEAPYSSLINAMTALGEGSGKIVVIGKYSYTSATSIADRPCDATIVGADEDSYISIGVTTSGTNTNIAFARSVYDNTITFDLPFKLVGSDTRIFLGRYNNIVFGDNFDVIAPDGGKFEFYGGLRSNGTAEDCICTTPYSITVNAGTFSAFSAGNNRSSAGYLLGSIAAPITVTINGGTFGEVKDYSTSNNKNYKTFDVSGQSILADDATLIINGGTFNCPVYVQGRLYTVDSSASQNSTVTASNRDYYAIDGDINVIINGGTFNGGMIGAYYTQGSYTTLMRGNYNVTINGGTFKEGTIVDATQVKGYEGSDTKATITYNDDNITPVRFDVVNDEVNEYDEPIRVTFIGASITQGSNSDTTSTCIDHSFPSVFLKLAEEAGKEVIIGNFGVGGSGYLQSTGKYYPDMVAWPMASEESDPTFVFFQMGTNDATPTGGTNGGKMLFEKNYRDMVLTMGNLPDTEKVFLTRSFYRNTDKSNNKDLRSASYVRPIQDQVAAELTQLDADKYIPVDLYGLTLDVAETDELFITSYGTVHERLHPSRGGYAILGQHCYNAAFEGIYGPEENYFLTDVYLATEEEGGRHFGKGTKDDPTSDLTMAVSYMEWNTEVTLHVSGNYACASSLILPYGLKKLTIVGETEDASFASGSTWMRIGSPTKFDNITLVAADSANGTTIICNYNDFELTETVKTTGLWHFNAGYNVYGYVDPATKASSYDTPESASSDNDCTIILNAGTFTKFSLGNYRYAEKAPVGTYSGTLNATIGENVTILADGSNTYAAINGHNYLTGTINANLASWAKTDIDTYLTPTKYNEIIVYDLHNNDGNVFVNFADGFEKKVNYMGDFDNNGSLTVKDLILTIEYVLNGFDSTKASSYYYGTVNSLQDVLNVAKLINAQSK